jgi:hypothetical protein
MSEWLKKSRRVGRKCVYGSVSRVRIPSSLQIAKMVLLKACNQWLQAFFVHLSFQTQIVPAIKQRLRGVQSLKFITLPIKMLQHLWQCKLHSFPCFIAIMKYNDGAGFGVI